MIPFKDQYNHPNWQKKRLEMLEQSGFECSCCGDSDKQLHVHHLFYKKNRKVWDYEDYELEVLCSDCHKRRHAVKSVLNESIALQHSSGGCAIYEILTGFVCGVDGPPALATTLTDSTEETAGKILGILFRLQSFKIIEDIVRRDIVSGNLDRFGDSPGLLRLMDEIDKTIVNFTAVDRDND